MKVKPTFKLARCRCSPSHQEPADCPQYGVPCNGSLGGQHPQGCRHRPVPPVKVRCLFCGYHDGRHGDDCDNGGGTAEERRASWNAWRNANMPGGE